MSRRSRAREVVLQVLYMHDLNPIEDLDPVHAFIRGRIHDGGELFDFAKSLLTGVLRNRDELDAVLGDIALNWSIERMAVTDRNVLRLGAFEIMYTTTPPRVAINEAVELAKRFGSKSSPPFVNGILDRLLAHRSHEAGESP